MNVLAQLLLAAVLIALMMLIRQVAARHSAGQEVACGHSGEEEGQADCLHGCGAHGAGANCRRDQTK